MKRFILIVMVFGVWVLLYPRGAAAQVSADSDYYEVKKRVYALYDGSKKEVKRHLAHIDRLLAGLDANTLGKFEQEMIAFLALGCHSNYYDQYSLFLPGGKNNRKKLRERLFKLLEKYNRHPKAQLIDEILASTETVDFRIFENKSYIKYSRKYKDGSSNLQEEIISQLKKLSFPRIEYYFKLFGYGVELFGKDAMLPHFRDKYLAGSIGIHQIRAICDALDSLSDGIRRDIQPAILTELSSYAYQLPVEKWLEIGNKAMIDFVPHSRFSNKNYIDKVVEHMTTRWDRALEVERQEILLLSLFLEREKRSAYRDIYHKLEPYFRNNAGRFLYLHEGENRSDNGHPDLISFLNENEENLERSINILTGLCRDQGEWPLELYKTVKTKYYPKSHGRIFTELLRPVYQGSGNDNRVRRFFLSDIYHVRFLEKEHSLEVARHFLNIDLKAPVKLESYAPHEAEKSPEIRNIQLVTALYLQYYNRKKLNKKKTVNYVNVILPELTGKIAENLFRNFEDYELLFAEMDKILQQLKAIHLRFKRIDYREMRALKEIYDKIKQEFRLTLGDKRLSPEDRRSRLVNVIGLSINIAGVLGDWKELNYIVKILRIDIFGVGSEGDGCKRIQLSQSQLKDRTDDFVLLDRDLRDAAFAVKKNKFFLAALYSDFYIPLIRIQGFLDRVYEYDSSTYSFQKERPYESLFKKLEEQDKKSSFKNLVTILNGAGYLNIDTSLKKLLAFHYKLLNVNLWKEPEQYPVNENSNLWIFHHLLEKMMEKDGPRKEYQYEKLLKKFTDGLGLPGGITAGTQQEFHALYRFIAFRVLNPYELKTFPLYDKNGEIEFYQLTGKPDEMIAGSKIKSRAKIDGHYRFTLIESMRKHLSSSDLQDLKLEVDTALLLPNSAENNKGDDDALSNYFNVKHRLFQMMSDRLTDQFRLNVDYVILLLKLEKSCRAKTLGFDKIYRGIKNRLSKQDQAALAIERMRLDLFETGTITLQRFGNYFDHLEVLIRRLREIYDIEPVDPIEYALIKMLGNKMNRAINLHELEQMYFIMTFFKNALAAANEHAETKEHFLSVLGAYNDVIEIYNHFLPFMYDLDLDFMTQQEHDILFLMLFDHNIKSSLVKLRERARGKLSKEDFFSIKEQYQKVVPYILTHNFADIELVFKNTDAEKLKIFELDRTIYYQVFNLNFLYQMLETKKLNAKTFIDEAFAGFAGNLDLIADVDDDVVYEYYFGDFRRRLFGDSYTSGQLEIKCVDDAVGKMVELSLIPQLPQRIKKPVEAVIRNPVGVFTKGFKNLETAAGMQKMWQGIVTKLAAKEPKKTADFYNQYQQFYTNAMFEQGGSRFRRDIRDSYIQKFSVEKDLVKQRQAVLPVLDHLNKAIRLHGKKPDFIYFVSHQQAVVNLMRSVVLGIKLKPEVPYIAKDIYDNQVGETGAVKAVDETAWKNPALFDLYDWIYDGKSRYEHAGHIKRLFLGQDSLNSYFVKSVHKYVEEKEKVYVEQLKKLNVDTEKRLHTLNSITRSLGRFQASAETEILHTYGLLVDLRKGHNRRVEKRTTDKIQTLQASTNQIEDIKDFYYRLKVKEGDVGKYARQWRYILCVLVPFSRYLGQDSLTLDSIGNLLENDDIFKFYFFYFYRIYNNRGTALRKYRAGYPGGNVGRVERFFASGLGFKYFEETFGRGQPNPYLNNRFMFNQIRTPVPHQHHIMVRRFQALCFFNGTGQNSFARFYKKKLAMFYEVLNEIDRVVTHPKRYLQLLYYVTHTFPYITAFKLDHRDNLKFVEKYPGDISPSTAPTPFKRLFRIWKNAPIKYKNCVKKLDAILGAIILLQIERLDIHRRIYEKTTLGNLDFFNPYDAIRHKLKDKTCRD